MIKTVSYRIHRYGQANKVIFVLAQPERQPHMHPSILLPHHIIIPASPFGSSFLQPRSTPHFATAALSTCVLKNPPFVRSITC
jgi:hypothetical protein